MTPKKISKKDIKIVKNQLNKLNEKQNDEIEEDALDNPLFPY